MPTHEQIIDAERAKSMFIHSEQVRPGMTVSTDLRRIIHSTQSEFQKIDVIESAFGKVLITDGKTQSAQIDEFVYHESLVHAPIIQSLLLSTEHGELRRRPELSVFIGGGGELATAREVLRHRSVTRVVMVDLDRTVIDVCKEYLPEWGGSSVSDDPRFELVVGDAFAYLADCRERFDVIVMDISDPIEAGPGIMLYTKEFYDHARTLLNGPNGVFVTQAGYGGSIDVGEEDVCFGPIANTLRGAFECVVPYTVYVQSFGSPWAFVMAFGLGTHGTDGGANEVDKAQVEDAVTSFTRMEVGKIDDIVSRDITDIEHAGKNADGEVEGADGSEVLRFYDGVSHQAMFSLPKDLRKAIANETRIMTKDNPIFMY